MSRPTGGGANESPALGPWTSVPVGLLADRHLLQVKSSLVRRDRGEVIVQQACLLVHVGEVVWRVSGSLSPRREVLEPREELELQPGEVVTIISDEYVRLPSFAAGRIFPKGRMGSIGLICSPTLIDPGFEGYLRITVLNVGAARIRLPRGLTIARVEIERLPVPVERQFGTYVDAKTSLPRDDYLFYGEPLVKDSFRLESLIVTVRDMEERLEQLEQGAVDNRRREEAARTRDSHRFEAIIRTLQDHRNRLAQSEQAHSASRRREESLRASALLIGLVVLCVLVVGHVLQWVRALASGRSQDLFVAVAGGILLAAALGLAGLLNRRLRVAVRSLLGVLRRSGTKSD